MAQEVIKLSGITKKYKDKAVLDNIDLSINKQEIIGITGPSGSGKSVLIKIIIGYLKQDKGTVSIKSRLGFSTQENSFYDNLTLRQNLNYFSKIYDVKERKDKIKEILRTLSLEEYEKYLVKNLSGGTKKRVDIACALLNEPEILILDEPFVGLDQLLIKQLSDFLTELNKNGMTIIMSSHVLAPIEALCNKIIFIKDKKLFLVKKSDLKEAFYKNDK
jgi:ABC-2 type transport system ATP-binding protein